MARGCGCRGQVSCEKVEECLQGWVPDAVEDWAPGAAYALSNAVTKLPSQNKVNAPVKLTYTTSTATNADVVDSGGGKMRIVRPGLWEVSAVIRFTAGASYAAAMYGQILGVDSEPWWATSIPITKTGSPTYSVGVTVVGAVTVTAGSSPVVSVAGNRSANAVNAQISSAVMVFKRLGPSSPAAADVMTPAGDEATSLEAELERERALLANEE